VHDKDGGQFFAPTPRFLSVRFEEISEGDGIIFHEPIKCLEFGTRDHGLGKTPIGLRLEPSHRASDSSHTAVIAQRKPIELTDYVERHAGFVPALDLKIDPIARDGWSRGIT